MGMNKYQILYKFFLFLILFFVFENVIALETSPINKKQNNIYIVGSNLGYEFKNINKYEFISTLKEKYNIVNLSDRNFSIYDQLNIFEEIDVLTDDKIIILLENFYLESIFFELNYINQICDNKKICNEIDIIQYEKMHLPLMDILHERLENLFSSHDAKKVIFLLDNSDFYHKKYNLKLNSNIYNNYFNYKDRYCFLSDIKDNYNFDCLNKYGFTN